MIEDLFYGSIKPCAVARDYLSRCAVVAHFPVTVLRA